MRFPNGRSIFAVLLSALMAMPAGTRAEDAQDLIRTLKKAIMDNESRFVNLHVTGEVYAEEWDKIEQKWTYAGEERATVWYLGVPARKVRFDFDEQVSQWVDGSAPFSLNVFSYACDGRIRQWLTRREGDPHATAPTSPRGEIHTLESSIIDSLYDVGGWPYSLYGGLGLNRKPVSAIFTEHPFTALHLEAKRVIFNGLPSIELHASSKRAFCKLTWYFDPAREFALVGAKLTETNDVINQEWTADELQQVQPGIYYPTKVTSQGVLCHDGTRIAGQPCWRRRYKASEVVMNDPNLSDEVFTIKWPVGAVVHDNVAGITFTVGQSPAELDKTIAEQVKRLKAAVRHPLTPQVTRSGGYWIPAWWLAGILVAGGVVVLLSRFTLKRRK